MALRFMEERIDFAAAFRWAARLGWQTGICNHFSWMVDDRHILINPQGLFWSEITASNLVLLDGDDNIIEGGDEVEETAFFVHVPTHRINPAAKIILHAHTPHATALACIKDGELKWCSQDALKFYGKVIYDREFNGSVLDAREGERIARKLGNHQIMFMAHHGVSVIGQNIAHALNDFYLLEDICRVQILAQSSGQELAIIPDVEIDRIMSLPSGHDPQVAPHFTAIKRVLDREEPSYRN